MKSEGPGNEKIPCAGARGARDLLTCSTDRVLTVMGSAHMSAVQKHRHKDYY